MKFIRPGVPASGHPGTVRFIYQSKRGPSNWNGTVAEGLESGVRYPAEYLDPATGRRFDHGVVNAPSGEDQVPRTPSSQVGYRRSEKSSSRRSPLKTSAIFPLLYGELRYGLSKVIGWL
jgi:hypothetical protein